LETNSGIAGLYDASEDNSVDKVGLPSIILEIKIIQMRPETPSEGIVGLDKGGFIEGPGTGTSDDIPAMIYQDGEPVQEARLSNNEFVMTEKAVKGAGGAARMYEMMKNFERKA